MAEVGWVGRALAELEHFAAYIRRFDERAAAAYEARLKHAGDSLSHFPNRGRPASQGRRELVGVWPYITRYRVIGDTVIITGVRYMRRRKRS